MLKSAEQIMGESKQEVPVAQSTLLSSAKPVPMPAREGKSIAVEFGYFAPYAFVIHQGVKKDGTILRVGKTGGFSPQGRKYPAGTWSAVGKTFFLSDPLNRHVKGGKFIANLRTELTTALKRTVARKHS
jgi:hypothetical protein